MEKLSGVLQENLLTLLCFSETAAQQIRGAVEPELFSSVIYRQAIDRVYAYLDQFQKPPSAHFRDLLDDLLAKNNADSEQYEILVRNVYELADHINEKYVMSQLSSFVRTQQLKIGLIKASESLQEGDSDTAENLLEAALKSRLQLFSPGMTLTDGFVKSLTHARQDYVKVGITELDNAMFGPARGELHLFIGPAKRGKSWWLIHLAKRSLLQRLRVLYVTLEISEQLLAQRLVQAFFSVQRKNSKVSVSRFVKDDLGRFIGIKQEELTKVLSLSEAGDVKTVKRKIGALLQKDNVMVKSFPTGTLTISALKAYLDSLERVAKFTPDVICLDYPALMKVDPKNLRAELGAISVGLRGLAVERNLAMCVVGQSNRQGAGSTTVKDTHASEDFSQVFTADNVITYSQTVPEKQLNLARLFASNTRVGDDDRFTVLISQSYRTGQFCLDSAMMRDTYWSHVEAQGGKNQEEEE